MPDNESSYQPDTAEDSDTPLAQIKARETERLTRKASNLSLSKKTKQVEHAKPAFEADSDEDSDESLKRPSNKTARPRQNHRTKSKSMDDKAAKVDTMIIDEEPLEESLGAEKAARLAARLAAEQRADLAEKKLAEALKTGEKKHSESMDSYVKKIGILQQAIEILGSMYEKKLAGTMELQAREKVMSKEIATCEGYQAWVDEEAFEAERARNKADWVKFDDLTVARQEGEKALPPSIVEQSMALVKKALQAEYIQA